MINATGWLALIFTLTFGPVVLAIFMPVVPAVQEDFKVTRQVAQLSLSAPLLAVLCAPVIAGLMVDQLGRKYVMLASVLIAMLGCVLSAVTDNYALFLAGRILAGLFSSLCLVVARAVMHDLFPADMLSKKMARFTLPPIGAMILAPLIGALFIDFFSWRYVFWLLAAFSLLTAVLIWFGLPETLKTTKAERESIRIGSLLGSWRLWAFVVQSSTHFGIAIGFCSAVAYVITHDLGRPTWEYSLSLTFIVLGLGSGIFAYEKLISAMDNGVFVWRASAATALIAALIYGTAELSMWPVNTALVVIPGFICAIGVGLAMSPSQAGILQSVSAQAGGASGLSSAMQMLSAAIFVHLMTLPNSEIAKSLPYFMVGGLLVAALASFPLSRSQAKAN